MQVWVVPESNPWLKSLSSASSVSRINSPKPYTSRGSSAMTGLPFRSRANRGRDRSVDRKAELKLLFLKGLQSSPPRPKTTTAGRDDALTCQLDYQRELS